MNKAEMLGRRRVNAEKEGGYKLGDYGKDYIKEGCWILCSPNGVFATLCSEHIFEHSDGTITISRKLYIHDALSIWEGYLKEGVWVGDVT